MNIQHLKTKYTGKVWKEDKIIYSDNVEKNNVLMIFENKQEAEHAFDMEKPQIPLSLRLKQTFCNHNQDIVLDGYREGQYFKFCSKCHAGKYVDERTPEQIQEQQEKSKNLYKTYKKSQELDILKDKYMALELRLDEYNKEYDTNITMDTLLVGEIK